MEQADSRNHQVAQGDGWQAMTEQLPKCQLVGIDGNAFSIIGAVARCLKEAGLEERAAEWKQDAFASGSYDELLQKLHAYVDAR